MNKSILGVALVTVGGIVFGALLGKCMTARKMKNWQERIESKQIDTDIRLDLLEYNHLHEDGDLRIFFDEAEDEEGL